MLDIHLRFGPTQAEASPPEYKSIILVLSIKSAASLSHKCRAPGQFCLPSASHHDFDSTFFAKLLQEDVALSACTVKKKSAPHKSNRSPCRRALHSSLVVGWQAMGCWSAMVTSGGGSGGCPIRPSANLPSRPTQRSLLLRVLV